VTRGPHPDDARLFGEGALPGLRAAATDLAWLLTRDYAMPSSLKLVGDRHGLDRRQRQGLQRSVCSDQTAAGRHARQLSARAVAGVELWIDGFNVLTTVETGLAGGVVLLGRDGAHRDIAGVHGSWRRGAATEPAIGLLAAALARCGAGPCVWWLDQPVSNSGRLRAQLEAATRTLRNPWRVEVVPNPDAVLRGAPGAVATSDGPVLDAAARWFDLTGEALAGHRGPIWRVDLRSTAQSGLAGELVL
jgi:hypothetical protein